LPQEIDDADRSYLTSQRARLVAQTEEMTGGVVEVRADALVLILPSDKGLDPSLSVSFPEATAADWVALLLLSGSIAASVSDETPGRRRCSTATIAALAAKLYSDHGPRLTVALREGPATIRTTAEQRLSAAGLLFVTISGDWVLPPTAARYRDADLVSAVSPPNESLLLEVEP